MIASCFVVFLLNQDSLASPNYEHRRFLLIDEANQVLDFGMEEEAWPRYLRTRNVHQEGWNPLPSWFGSRRMEMVPAYADKHHFEECTGRTIEECRILINSFVTENPEQFNNNTRLRFDVRKIREETDEGYFKVVLRTNMDGDEIHGLLEDGIVYYPWPWRVEGQDNIIGPWDCKNETTLEFLNPSECCSMIQRDVNVANDYGDYLACFVEQPVGGPDNPEMDDRAIVVVDAEGVVVRPPVAH